MKTMPFANFRRRTEFIHGPKLLRSFPVETLVSAEIEGSIISQNFPRKFRGLLKRIRCLSEKMKEGCISWNDFDQWT
jgi:hypothetical protein